MIVSKGFSVTTGYTTAIAANGSRASELCIQNNTPGVLYVTIGGATTDADALLIPSGSMLSLSSPVGSVVKMKSTVAGNVVLVGDQL